MQNNEYDEKDKRYIDLINYAYNHKLSLSRVALDNDLRPAFLTKIKRKYGILTKRFNVPNKRITEEIEKEMINLYSNGFTSSQIAKEYGYATRNTVLYVLKKHNIERRSNLSSANYNYDFFKKIDSYDKAYILGLFYTDGYVYKNYDGLCIQLTIGDKYLLDRIAKVFGSSASVIEIDCTNKRKKIPHALDMARLAIYSKVIAQQGKKLGIIRNKSHKLELTNKIYKKYRYSFLRGVIDGDGTIVIGKNNHICCQFSTMSKNFAKQICNNFVNDVLNCYTIKKTGIKLISIGGGNKKVISFLKKIYKNKSNLYLERKYAKVQDKIN